MKNLLLTATVIFLYLVSWSAQDTAIVDGNWNAASTWSSHTPPASGDVLVIPDGITVTVNCNCGTYTDMAISIYGTLEFPGGRKINMTIEGRIDIYPGGTIEGTNNGDKIIINSNTVWTGSSNDLLGPITCISGGCTSNQTLPVELLYSTATPHGYSIEVTWATATETGNDYFTLWRSMDYTNWEILAEVPGAGNSNQMSVYSFSDADVEPGIVYYYQLSQTDFDGTREEVGETTVAQLNSGQVNLPQVFPNPAHDVMNIILPPYWAGSRIKLFDQNGNMMPDSMITMSEGYCHIDLDSLRNGTYILYFQSAEGEVHTQQFIVN